MRGILFIGVILLLVSCSSKYEKVMSDYLQTVDNVKTDLKFKLLEAKEVGTITVKDSLEHFKFHRQYWKENRMPEAQMYLAKYEKMKIEYWDLKDQRERLQADVDKAKVEYESYLNDTFKYPYGDNGIKKYSALPLEQVLANKVECKYSIFNPLIKAQQEYTITYVLSPDGKVCYGEFKPLTEVR